MGASAPALPRVVGIVLNYNGRDVTLEALKSLKGMSYPRLRLLVVDNGSSDGSYEAVAAAFPDVEQVRTEVNLGGAGGYGLGLRHAYQTGDDDYLMLLNNDIEVDPEMLTEMVKAAESDPRIGCVGPKAYYHGDRQRIWSAGGILQFRESVTRERGQGQIDRGQFDRDQEVDYVNGCAILMRRAAIEAAGFWDPVYFLSADDADWCMRVKRAGWRCWYAHRARLWHIVSWSLGISYNAAKVFYTGRSMGLFVRRYARPWQWLSFLAWISVALPLAYLREARKGNQAAVLAKLRGIREGLTKPFPPPPAPVAAGEGTRPRSA